MASRLETDSLPRVSTPHFPPLLAIIVNDENAVSKKDTDSEST